MRSTVFVLFSIFALSSNAFEDFCGKGRSIQSYATDSCTFVGEIDSGGLKKLAITGPIKMEQGKYKYLVYFECNSGNKNMLGESLFDYDGDLLNDSLNSSYDRSRCGAGTSGAFSGAEILFN